MYSFHDLGFTAFRFLGSIRIFLCFLGHLVSTFFHILITGLHMHWRVMGFTLFHSGIRLAMPVIAISGLAGFSLAMSLHGLLGKFFMQDHALDMSETMVIRTFVPLLVGMLMSIQSGLNLINSRIHKLDRSSEETMLEDIIPIMLGLLLSGLFLYIYALFACLTTIHATFYYILQVENGHNLFNVLSGLSTQDLLNSMAKNTLYGFIVSLVVGYYYYEISVRDVTLRRGVSNIMTRSLLWIIFSTVYIDLVISH